MRARLFPTIAAPLAFALLATSLAAGGFVAVGDSVFSSLAAASGLVPCLLCRRSGWRGRVAELILLPTAAALLLVADEVQRNMLVALLLAATALAAGWQALSQERSGRRALCAAAVALALTAINGAWLVHQSIWRIALALTPVFAAAVAARAGGVAAPLCVALGATLPIAAAPYLAVVPALAAAATARWSLEQLATRLLPPLVAGAAACTVLGGWGGMSPALALPDAKSLAIGLIAAVLVVLPQSLSALRACGWFCLTALLGAPVPPCMSGQSARLTAALPLATVPVSQGARLVLETSVAHAGRLPEGALVAVAQCGSREFPLRVGRDTAEWAHEREDVRAEVAHSLPEAAIWRPAGYGRGAFWAVAGRMTAGDVPTDTIVLRRNAALPKEVVVTVAALSAAPHPPRLWPAIAFLTATAVVVGLIQLLSGSWRSPSAVVPWLLLTTGSLFARIPVEPLQSLTERYGVDLSLAALVAAWLAAARLWLARRRTLVAAAAFLVPIALATPRLTPPMYGDEPYHLAILEALSHGGSLKEAVLAGAPPGLAPLHGPFLATLLLPGYLVGGRSGALALLAVAAAVTVALVARRATMLAVPARRVSVLSTLAILTAPLATYASQIWPEVVGALAVGLGLTLATGSRFRRWLPVVVAAAAAMVKTRLGLVCFPIAAASMWGAGSHARTRLRALTALGVAAAAALITARVFLGHFLGAPRSLASLVPGSVRSAVLAAGGLLFDPSAGFAFAAPLLLAAMLGVPRLWRTAGPGERAALVGLVATGAALLHSVEWYGGGSPPVRYLVAGLPVLWLAGAVLTRRPPPALAAATVLLPPAFGSAWALLARPHLSVNPGSGRFYVTDALALRFGTDTRHLVPSFLAPSPATWLFPVALTALVVGVVLAASVRPGWARALGRQSVALWITALAVLAAHLAVRTDRTVEIEDVQVVHLGGRPEPPAGTWSTYLHRNGWRLGDGEGVVVPLKLAHAVSPMIVGWLEGAAREGSVLEARWDKGETVGVPAAGAGVGRLALPPAPSPGRHVLRLTLRAPRGGEAVLDRLVVAP